MGAAALDGGLLLLDIPWHVRPSRKHIELLLPMYFRKLRHC